MSDDPSQPSRRNSPSPRRTALDWVAETVGNDALLLELNARAQRRRRSRAVIASGALVMLLVGIALLRPFSRHSGTAGSERHLLVSLPQQQVLPDGSLAELREGARIAVDFSGSQRRISLLNGDAHFEVKKDPSRPFIVQAGGVEVRAVGTAFAVQTAPRGVEVLVTEGRVAIDHATKAASVSQDAISPLAFVAAGEATTIMSWTAGEASPDVPRVTAIDEAEMTERLSWRVPRLELSGTPLEIAVEAFNRHSKVKLVIGEPSLSRLQVSGIVRADQADALVSLLAANFDVTAEVRGGETVLLRRTPANSR